MIEEWDDDAIDLWVATYVCEWEVVAGRFPVMAWRGGRQTAELFQPTRNALHRAELLLKLPGELGGDDMQSTYLLESNGRRFVGVASRTNKYPELEAIITATVERNQYLEQA